MRIETSEGTETLAGLLREYTDKLTELNREIQLVLVGAVSTPKDASRIAWLLDRSKRLDQPMRELVNLVSDRVLTPWLGEDNGVSRTEMALRLGEAEAQLHHLSRQSYDLQKQVDDWKLTDHVARLRESAGLNAMKGGPLRPKS